MSIFFSFSFFIPLFSATNFNCQMFSFQFFSFQFCSLLFFSFFTIYSRPLNLILFIVYFSITEFRLHNFPGCFMLRPFNVNCIQCFIFITDIHNAFVIWRFYGSRYYAIKENTNESSSGHQKKSRHANSKEE